MGLTVPIPYAARSWCQFKAGRTHFFIATSDLIEGAAQREELLVLFIGFRPPACPPFGSRLLPCPPTPYPSEAEIPFSLKLMAVRRFHLISSGPGFLNLPETNSQVLESWFRKQSPNRRRVFWFFFFLFFFSLSIGAGE